MQAFYNKDIIKVASPGWRVSEYSIIYVFHVDFIFFYKLSCAVAVIFLFSIILSFCVWLAFKMLYSHFLKLSAEDPQHNFCMMYFFLIIFIIGQMS